MSNRVIIDQTTNTVSTDQCPEIHNSVVVNNDVPSTIDVIENITNIVTVTVPGPQGPAGPQGPTGLGGDITGSQYYVPLYKSATGLITSSIYQSGSFTSIRNATSPEDPANPDILYVNGDGVDTYNLISAHGNKNSYLQINVQNYNGSTEASSDIVATADNGTESENYINMGINSSGFTNTGNVGGQNDAYLYSTGNDLYIGNASAGKQIIIFNGGLDAANQAKVWIHDQGTVGINTDTYNTSNPPSLQVNAPNDTTYNIAQFFGNTDNYAQVGITNANIGTTASADLVLYNNIDYENQLAGFVDLGINSTNYVYNGVYPGSAGDAYLFTDSEHLVIGSVSGSGAAKITLFAGGISEFENAKLTLYGNNQHQMTGSLIATEGFSGSLFGTASWALNALTASYLSGYVSPFPYTGSAIITGSLTVTGSVNFGGQITTSQRTGSGVLINPVLNLTSSNQILSALDVNPTASILAIGGTTNTSIIGVRSTLNGGNFTSGIASSYAGYFQNNMSDTFLTAVGIYAQSPTNPAKFVAGNNTTWDFFTNSDADRFKVLATSKTQRFEIAVGSATTAMEGGTTYGSIGTVSNNDFQIRTNNSVRMLYPSGSTNYNTLYGSLYVSGSLISLSDATINTIRVGLGPGSIASNTVIGFESLNSNTTGNSNVAVGYQTLRQGSSNNSVAVGYAALYTANANNNIGIGFYAGFGNSSGTQNIAIGSVALLNQSTGNNNVALGYGAGRYISTGTDVTISDNSIFIGADTRALGNNQTNQIVIGHNAIGLGSNTTVIGNTSTTTALIYGNVTASGSFTAQSITASNALINGTITAQTLVVQTITSSVDFVTGSTRFGSLLTNTHQFTGSVSVTGSLTVVGRTTINDLTGSLFGTSSWALNSLTASYVSSSNVVGTVTSASYALTASYALNAGVAGAAFPFTGSAQITGSLGVTGSVAITGSLNVGSSNIEYQENTNVTTGTWRVVSSEPTASYRAAFFDYVMFSGSVARAGTVYSVWSASYAEYYENYTGDVGGSTSGVTLQAAISGSNIQLQATSSNNSWTIRSLVRML